MGNPAVEVGSSFVFFVGAGVFVCMANNPVRDYHRDALTPPAGGV